MTGIDTVCRTRAEHVGQGDQIERRDAAGSSGIHNTVAKMLAIPNSKNDQRRLSRVSDGTTVGVVHSASRDTRCWIKLRVLTKEAPVARPRAGVW
jgi:hypothetical protein